MKEAGNGAEDLSLGAFARTRRAKEKDTAI